VSGLGLTDCWEAAAALRKGVDSLVWLGRSGGEGSRRSDDELESECDGRVSLEPDDVGIGVGSSMMSDGRSEHCVVRESPSGRGRR